jgi:SAM-dependent methyltransferase
MKDAEWFADESFWLDFKEMMYDPDRLQRTEQDVQDMIRLCGLRPKMRILDHCCGFGRHALQFAALGYQTSGVDRCATYLDMAKAKSDKKGYAIQWHHQDIRHFVQPESYDFAYNFFTSFGYIEDPEEELQVVRNVYNSLKKGGQFLIDVLSKETLARDYQESEWFDGQDGSIMLVETQILDNWCRIQNRWGYVKDGQYKETIFAHKIYSAKELADLLIAAGFSQVSCYGNLQGSAYDIHAQRLIVVGYKE